MLGIGLLVARVVREFVDLLIIDDGLRRDGRAEHHSFEGLAAREGYVCLSVCEAVLDVDDGVFEGEALRLVYGDGPGCLQRVLREGADDLFRYLLCLGIQIVSRVLPFDAFYVDVGVLLCGVNDDGVFLE